MQGTKMPKAMALFVNFAAHPLKLNKKTTYSFHYLAWHAFPHIIIPIFQKCRGPNPIQLPNS